MLRLVLIYCPPIKVSPSSVLQPNILWVMKFSSLASERRHSSLTVVAAGSLTTNPFEWFFPKTGFLKCMHQGTFSWIVKSDSLHLWSFLWSPCSSVFWHVSTMIFLDCQLWLLNSGVMELCWVTTALHVTVTLTAAKLDSYQFLVSQEHWLSSSKVQHLESHHFLYFVCFLVVSGKRVNPVPVFPPWQEEKALLTE